MSENGREEVARMWLFERERKLSVKVERKYKMRNYSKKGENEEETGLKEQCPENLVPVMFMHCLELKL